MSHQEVLISAATEKKINGEYFHCVVFCGRITIYDYKPGQLRLDSQVI